MNKKLNLLALTLIVLSSCDNPRATFSDVPVANDSTDLATKVDSAHTIKKDGVQVDPPKPETEQ